MLIEALKKELGEDNIVNVITFGKMLPKGLIKHIGKILGFSYGEVEGIAKLIPKDNITEVRLSDLVTTVLKPIYEKERYNKLFNIALKLEDVHNNISVHAAGIIKGDIDNPIYNHCPLYRSKNNELLTQYNMKHLELTGLQKLDLLGLKTLNLLKEVLILIKDRHNFLIDINKLPLNDKQTFDLINNLDLEGVFQFSGDSVVPLIRLIRPYDFNELNNINALSRPGAIKHARYYRDVKYGVIKPEYLHKIEEEITESTNGIALFQEQAIEFFKKMAKQSLGKADLARRAIGKKDAELMKSIKKEFIEGCLGNNIEESIAEKIFHRIEEFSGYGFNKSHSVAYALIGYQCAYLKAHYSLEFMTCLLNIDQDDDKKTSSYFYNLNNLNIKLLYPSVLYSKDIFIVEEDCIRFSLRSIKSLGYNLSHKITKENSKSPFKDLSDFITRIADHMNRRQLEKLITSGSLDCFGYSRELLLENLEDLLKQRIYFYKESIYNKLTRLEILNKEYEAFGFYFNHPIRLYRDLLEKINCFSIKESRNKKKGYFIGSIVDINRRRKNNFNFAFVQITDETGVCSLILSGEVLTSSNDLLEEGSILGFLVEIDNRLDGLKYRCTEVCTLDTILNLYRGNINLKIDNEKTIDQLQNYLYEKEKGKVKVYIHNKSNIKKLDNEIRLTTKLINDLDKLNIEYNYN